MLQNISVVSVDFHSVTPHYFVVVLDKYTLYKLNLKKKKKSPMHDADNKTDRCFKYLCCLFLTSSKRRYSLVLHISMDSPHLLTSALHIY